MSTRYVTDVAYPGHVHRETAPAWLHAVATALGQRTADPAQAFRWCELGCGTGLNAVLLAAAYPHGRFVAVDFNRGHVERGRDLADAAGLDNIEFILTDFAGFAATATPDADGFDFIVCHGVWSWVAPDVQQALLSVVDRRLRPDGLFYLGYMSHPGASPMAVVQRLLRARAETSPGDSGQRAAAAVHWLQALADAGLGCVAEHPGLRQQIDALAHEQPAQVAHEFLAPDWQPAHVGEVIEQLAGIGCHYVGSATALENIDSVSLPGNVQPLIAEIADPALRETAKDAARNQSLRRDLYQRAGHRLAPAEHRAALDRIRFAALPGAPTGGDLTFETRIGPVQAPAALFAPVLSALAASPKSFEQLARLPAYAPQAGQLNIVLQSLLWAGCVHPCYDLAPTQASQRLNALLAASAEEGSSSRWRAEPAFGCALPAAAG